MPSPMNNVWSAAGWDKGAVNTTPADRVPEGAVRRLVNMDPSPAGTLELRTGFTKVLSGTDVRAVFSVRDHLVIVDGTDVNALSVASGELRRLGAVQAGGPVHGTVHNDELFVSTLQGGYRTDAYTWQPWGVAQPSFEVQAVAGGGLPAGQYKVAVTAVGAVGEESGASAQVIQLDGSQNLRLTTPDERPLRIYCSVANGAALFYQGVLLEAQALSLVDDSTETLETEGLAPPPAMAYMASHRGVIVGASGALLVFTAPLSPHLMDPVEGFIAYPKDVDMVAATPGGVYIAADKTYFVADLEAKAPNAPQQRTVLDFGAVAGTMVPLPDGSATWFTRFGQVIGSPGGDVRLLNERTYAPNVAASGAAGMVERDGKRLVITAMKGPTKDNNLATGDFAELEIG